MCLNKGRCYSGTEMAHTSNYRYRWKLLGTYGYQSVFRSRIRIQSRQWIRQEGKNDLLSIGCPFSRPRDKKIAIFDNKKIFSCKCFSIFAHRNPGSGSVFSLKCWIRIPNQWVRIRHTGTNDSWAGIQGPWGGGCTTVRGY